jgi:hypothetical protein
VRSSDTLFQAPAPVADAADAAETVETAETADSPTPAPEAASARETVSIATGPRRMHCLLVSVVLADLWC